MTKTHLADLKKQIKEIKERHAITGKPGHPDWRNWVIEDGNALLSIVDELMAEVAGATSDSD